MQGCGAADPRKRRVQLDDGIQGKPGMPRARRPVDHVIERSHEFGCAHLAGHVPRFHITTVGPLGREPSGCGRGNPHKNVIFGNGNFTKQIVRGRNHADG